MSDPVSYADGDGKATVETFETTDDHPWRTASGMWTQTMELKPGVRILRARGPPVTVVSVVRTGVMQGTYNFEVADWHTYFVGDAGVWVHHACPNPNGRAGGIDHQRVVSDVKADIEARGLEAVTEYRIVTPGGERGSRCVDVAGRDPNTGQVVETHQVGRQTVAGAPVARERRAMDDIQKAGKKRPRFHPYN